MLNTREENLNAIRLHYRAIQHQTHESFLQNEPDNYNMATDLNLLDEICSHMLTKKKKVPKKKQRTYKAFKPYKKWDMTKLMTVAYNYTSQKNFIMEQPDAWDYAKHLEVRELVIAHMEKDANKRKDIGNSDNDAVYIWKHPRPHPHKNVYKIGVTSSRLGKSRIINGAKSAKTGMPEIIINQKVNCKASDIEFELLKMGYDPHYSGFGGCTEFRVLDDEELEQAVDTIKNHA